MSGGNAQPQLSLPSVEATMCETRSLDISLDMGWHSVDYVYEGGWRTCQLPGVAQARVALKTPHWLAAYYASLDIRSVQPRHSLCFSVPGGALVYRDGL